MTQNRSKSSQFTSAYCGDYYGIADQRDGETDDAFRRRVAAELREKGKVIEAHEVFQGHRWDDKESESAHGTNVMDGIQGAVLLALNPQLKMGDNVNKDGEHILDDEAILGAHQRFKRENPDPPIGALLLALGMNPFEFQSPDEIADDLKGCSA